MPLPALSAHALCVGLVAADVLARAVRLRRVLRMLGHKIGLARLTATILSCDAACVLTPYRAGGDALRLASLARAGVPLRHSLAAVGYESLQSWPVILLCGTGLAWAYGAEWSRSLIAGARAWSGMLPWLMCLLVLPLVVGLGFGLRRYLRRRGPLDTRPSISQRFLRSAGLLRVTVPLTFVSVASRVSILPVLAATFADAPPFGQSAAGSFALLHSQLILPLPAGAGAVDLGFLAGAGHAARAGLLLLWWRVYTAGVGLVLGLAALPLSLARCHQPPLAPHPRGIDTARPRGGAPGWFWRPAPEAGRARRLSPGTPAPAAVVLSRAAGVPRAAAISETGR